jgi:Helix-turn-helix domain
MRKTFKYRLYPTKATEQKLFWTLTRCRELYNAALSERRDAYTYAGKSITYYDQQNTSNLKGWASRLMPGAFPIFNTSASKWYLLHSSTTFLQNHNHKVNGHEAVALAVPRGFYLKMGKIAHMCKLNY